MAGQAGLEARIENDDVRSLDLSVVAFAFDAVENGFFQKSKERISAIQVLSHFSMGTGAPNARFDPRGLKTMSQLEEAVARLTQARSKLAPITECLRLDWPW
jgi:hypothetical protein